MILKQSQVLEIKTKQNGKTKMKNEVYLGGTPHSGPQADLDSPASAFQLAGTASMHCAPSMG